MRIQKMARRIRRWTKFRRRVPAFIHIPKTGGTYLGQLESTQTPVIQPVKHLGHRYVVTNPDSLNPIYNVPPYNWPKYTINYADTHKYLLFVVVRNIYDWLVSYYHHAGGTNEKYRNMEHYDYALAQKGFDYLVNSIMDREDIWPNRKFIFFQVFADNGKLVADYILRNSTLDADLEWLAQAEKLEYHQQPRQRVGHSDDYKPYYSSGLIQKVESTWNREMLLYGFSFDKTFDNSDKALLRKKISKYDKDHISYCYSTDTLKILPN